jgi:regulator of sigma E protease
MIVISAGVIMNILLAIGIFWGISYMQGDSLMQTTEIGMIVRDSPAAAAGLQSGDKIVSINGKAIDHWEAIQTTIYFDMIGKDIDLVIERDGAQQPINIPREKIPDVSETTFGIIPNFTVAVINDVLAGKPADNAGLQSDDIILAINGEPVFNQDQVIRVISANPERTVSMELKRGEEIRNISVTPASDGRIGITVSARYTGPVTIVQYGLLESFPRGVRQTVNATTLFGHSIWQLIVGKAEFTKSVGGPVKIAQIATRSAEIGFLSFLAFMALLSISLAVMNILPFPALDGGHLILLIYELIAKKPLPHRIQIRIQQVGMVILLSFMVFVLYNDIFG